MRGSLGSLLLLWSRIEQSAREEVTRLYSGSLPKSSHGIAAVLNTWESAVIARQPDASLGPLLASTLRAQIQEHLNIRNGVCHGLRGISDAYDETPATLTWEINGKVGSITWSEFQASFSWLCKVPFAISMISNSSCEKVGNRMIDSSENREWWLHEYGLNVTQPSLSASSAQAMNLRPAT